MTQEILDCLLIKSKFVTMTKEELVEQTYNEQLENIMINIICEIMSMDCFFFSSDEVLDKLEYLLEKIRYGKKYDKDTIDGINEILININIFKTMNKQDQETIRNDWLYNEIELRMLSIMKWINYSTSYIYDMIKTDYFYINSFINNPEEIHIYNQVNFLTSINLLSNQFITIYQENPDLIPVAIEITKQLKIKIFSPEYLFYSKLAKQTKKKLIEVKESFKEIEDFNKQYQVKIKKRMIKD